MYIYLFFWAMLTTYIYRSYNYHIYNIFTVYIYISAYFKEHIYIRGVSRAILIPVQVWDPKLFNKSWFSFTILLYLYTSLLNSDSRKNQAFTCTVQINHQKAVNKIFTVCTSPNEALYTQKQYAQKRPGCGTDIYIYIYT